MNEEYYFQSKYHRCLCYRHRLSQELYLTMCGIEQCLPGKTYGPKQRPGYHLHAIISGEGVLDCGGTLIPLHAGQLFLLKPAEIHHYYASSEKPWAYCWVTFDGQRAAYYMEQAGFSAGVNTLSSYVDTDAFYELARQLLANPELNLGSDLRRQGLLHQFIGLAVDSHARSGRGRRNAVYSTDSYVDHALDFINANFDRIKVADIAAFIGIDRSYFTNIFTRRMGMSPQRYLLLARMCYSAQMLLDTDSPIREIARKAGYENPMTFSRIFKSFYGVSPRQYRAQPEEARVYLEMPGRPEGGIPRAGAET